MNISFVILFLNLGLRNFSGIDDPVYKQIFELINKEGLIRVLDRSELEVGYLLLNKIISLLTDKYIYMQLITSFIPLYLFFRVFKKYKEFIDIRLAIFFLITTSYFQMISASLIRFFIAIAIVANSYEFFLEKDKKKYILVVIIASFFHISSLFMLILLFIPNKQDRNKKYLYFYLIILILSPIVFSFIAKFIAPVLGSRYSIYSNALYKNGIYINDFDTIPIIILILISFNFIKVRKDDYLYVKKFFTLFIFLFSLSPIISIYGGAYSLGRLLFYSQIGLIFSASVVSNFTIGKLYNIFFNFIMVSYGYFYLYITQFSNINHVYYLFPYRNIFFNI